MFFLPGKPGTVESIRLGTGVSGAYLPAYRKNWTTTEAQSQVTEADLQPK